MKEYNYPAEFDEAYGKIEGVLDHLKNIKYTDPSKLNNLEDIKDDLLNSIIFCEEALDELMQLNGKITALMETKKWKKKGN